VSDEARDVNVTNTTVLAKHHGTLSEVTVERRRTDGTHQTLRKEIYDNGSSASILPFDEKLGTVLLVKQFRPPVFLKTGQAFFIEACAGKLEGEEPATRIVKEAEEELGYRIMDPVQVFQVFMSPAGFMEMITLFVASYSSADKVSAGGGLADEGEDITVLELPLDDALAMVHSGTIFDAKTILLLQHLQLSRRDR
jgi:GDP-mannose pyrophosphatase NudK